MTTPTTIQGKLPEYLPLGSKEAQPFIPMMPESYYAKWERLYLAWRRNPSRKNAVALSKHETSYGEDYQDLAKQFYP